jgi:hypothetical protein
VTVFVSYSSRDRDAVKSLTQDLQDADEQVWMDQRLAGGEAWWRAILEQIRGCDVFIFALSQSSIDSKPCQAELQYAQALGLPILPVQVGLACSPTEAVEPQRKDLDRGRRRGRRCSGDRRNRHRNPVAIEAGPRRRRFRSNPIAFEPARHHKQCRRNCIVSQPGQRRRRRGFVGTAADFGAGVVVCGSQR